MSGSRQGKVDQGDIAQALSNLLGLRVEVLSLFGRAQVAVEVSSAQQGKGLHSWRAGRPGNVQGLVQKGEGLSVFACQVVTSVGNVVQGHSELTRKGH